MIYQVIQQLIDRAINIQLIEQEDAIYTRNKILSLLRLDDFVVEAPAPGLAKAISELLEELIEYACMHKIIEEVLDEKEILASAIMDVLCPNRPLSILYFMKNTNKIRRLRQITSMN